MGSVDVDITGVAGVVSRYSGIGNCVVMNFRLQQIRSPENHIPRVVSMKTQTCRLSQNLGNRSDKLNQLG